LSRKFVARVNEPPAILLSFALAQTNVFGQKGDGIMRIIVATILAAVAIFGAAPSWAQTPTSQELTRTGRPGAQQPPHTLFTIGGFNAVVDAPVATPDSGRAYENYQGQPMRSGAAILAGAARMNR
jgi:hypothetical protein